ncbi:MAG TPA: chemotaxis protein CheB, partial [Clostridia bacterium]|nr:chemotaxis protein CheB [Clostridia bacterium]
MPKRDIIVMGASAGGTEACCGILEGLPSDLPASVLIVQHVGRTSLLAEVLRRCCALKVNAASDGEAVRPGRAYVAPGDHHLLLEDGKVRLSRGPRENRQRPSVDALFRSAARAHRSQVIAVVLSGALDDGATGVLAVKLRGGVVIIQDPQTARFSSMPENALRAVRPDYCVPPDQIAPLLVKLTRQEITMPKNKKTRAATNHPRRRRPSSAAASFVCPECGGPLFPDKQGTPGQLTCLVGHSFAPESLSEAHREALERAVLTTMRLLQ